MTTSSTSQQPPSPVLEHARWYASLGLPVLRIATKTKRPIEGNGFYDATIDPGEVQDRFAGSPDVGIAIRTGEPLADGRHALALDFDVKNGGLTVREQLRAKYGDAFDDTLRQRTGGGGEHAIFSTDQPLPCRVDVLPGMDVRGAGGYVVSAPSLHQSGNRYALINTHPILHLPAEVERRLRERIPLLDVTRDARDADQASADIIAEGTRNAQLTSIGGTLRNTGLGKSALLDALRSVNRERCRPPLDESEVAGIAKSLMRYPQESTAGKKPSPAQQAVMLFEECELFHCYREPYAVVPTDDVRSIVEIRSGDFRQLVQSRYWARYRDALSDQALKSAVQTLAGKAVFDGDHHDVHTRIGGDLETVVLDLANDRWEATRISADEIRTVYAADTPRFRRPATMLALPRPAVPGDIEQLRLLLNISDEMSWRLVVGFLLIAMRPIKPYPLLGLFGPQGSGKSTASRLIASILDPSQAILRSMHTGQDAERNLYITARNRWILVNDNVSKVTDAMSDAMCRLSTGGGMAQRALHTDRDELIFDYTRCQIVNGITDFATRPDLLSRMYVVRLASLDGRHITEVELENRFARAHPAILGALCEATQTAIRNLPTTDTAPVGRLADAEIWATAGETAFGWNPGSFSEALRVNHARLAEVALEASPLAQIVTTLVSEHGRWIGTATDLLEIWRAHRVGNPPVTAKGCSDILERTRATLIDAGYTVERHRVPGTGQRLITLDRAADDRHPRHNVTTADAQYAIEQTFGPTTSPEGAPR